MECIAPLAEGSRPPEQLDRKDWCGGFRATASGIEVKMHRRRMKAPGGARDAADIVIGGLVCEA